MTKEESIIVQSYMMWRHRTEEIENRLRQACCEVAKHGGPIDGILVICQEYQSVFRSFKESQQELIKVISEVKTELIAT